MKQYFIGFITGACLIASTFMFIGAGESGEVGRYQLSPGEYKKIGAGLTVSSPPIISKSIFKIDTKTGDVYEFFDITHKGADGVYLKSERTWVNVESD